MLPNDLEEKFDLIHNTANLFIHEFGPEFTNTPEGHIVTDIIGASFTAGTGIIRSTVKELEKYSPGKIILADVHNDQSKVLNFITGVALTFGVDLRPNVLEHTKERLNVSGKDIVESNQPLMPPIEMAKILEPKLVKACETNEITKEYGSFVAVLTAGKLIGAGIQIGIVKLAIARELLTYYVVAGSKTVPYPLNNI